MSDVFTRNLKLANPGDELSADSVDEMKTALRGMIIGVLKHRGLLSVHPRCLGHAYEYYQGWNDEALSDLTTHGFLDVILKERDVLQSKIRHGHTIDALVRLKAKQFIHGLQRKANPRETRVYDKTREVLSAGIEEDRLRGEPLTKLRRVESRTVIWFQGESRPAVIAAEKEIDTSIDDDKDWHYIIQCFSMRRNLRTGRCLDSVVQLSSRLEAFQFLSMVGVLIKRMQNAVPAPLTQSNETEVSAPDVFGLLLSEPAIDNSFWDRAQQELQKRIRIRRYYKARRQRVMLLATLLTDLARAGERLTMETACEHVPGLGRNQFYEDKKTLLEILNDWIKNRTEDELDR